jgi:hypothetical protein
MDVHLMQQLDRIHAQLGNGFAPPQALSSYLSFLETMPDGASFSPKTTAAVAMIDNVLALDELKLEKRKLGRTLDSVESATYELLVRIGRKHAEIINLVAA